MSDIMKYKKWDNDSIKDVVSKEGYELISFYRDNQGNVIVECLCKNKKYYKFKLKSLVHENKHCNCCNAKNEESFKFKNPIKSNFWDYNKNESARPEYCKGSSHEKYWFKCENNHSFKIGLDDITNSNSWCPYCSGRYVTEENNFVVKNPERAKFWDYEKNKNINPRELLSSIPNKKYWFVCEEGHSFRMTLNAVTSKTQWCPYCSKCKGERKINKILKNTDIDYETQKEFPNLLGINNGKLSYDFYLPQYNLLIEYQGEFHDGSSSKYAKNKLSKQKEHDRRKREYAENNNIKLLEIWYWDFENIEEILMNNIKNNERIN